MKPLSIKELNAFLATEAFELNATQTKLCFPIIQRIHLKMRHGIPFSNIAVCDSLIINGHHRYICSMLLKNEIGRSTWTSSPTTAGYSWTDIEIDTADWEREEEIDEHHETDALKLGVDMDYFKELPESN